MLKAGLIIGVVGFFSTLVVSLWVPACALCLGIFLGLGAGYLACGYGRPIVSSESVRVGAGAGALAAGLMIPGQMIAAAINASMSVTLEGSALNELLGLPPSDPTVVWVAQLLVGCCIGLLNLGILAGTGAGGGALWFQRNDPSRDQTPIPPAL